MARPTCFVVIYRLAVINTLLVFFLFFLSPSQPSNDSTSEGADQLLGAVGGSEETVSQSSSQPPQSSRNCRPPRLGLLGGGETSLNNGSAAPATGWGAPPPGPQGGWGSGSAQWGATANTRGGPEYAAGGPNGGADAGGASSPTKPTAAATAGSWGQGTATAVTKATEASDSKSSAVAPRNILEEPVSELRRMAAFSEGWGQSVSRHMPLTGCRSTCFALEKLIKGGTQVLAGRKSPRNCLF